MLEETLYHPSEYWTIKIKSIAGLKTNFITARQSTATLAKKRKGRALKEWSYCKNTIKETDM